MHKQLPLCILTLTEVHIALTGMSTQHLSQLLSEVFKDYSTLFIFIILLFALSATQRSLVCLIHQFLGFTAKGIVGNSKVCCGTTRSPPNLERKVFRLTFYCSPDTLPVLYYDK